MTNEINTDAGSWALCIAVLGLPAGIDAAERQSARLSLMLAAHRFGYFPIEVFEVVRAAPGADDVHRRIEELARLFDVDPDDPGPGGRGAGVDQLVRERPCQALLVAGDLDGEPLARIADDLRMVVRRMDRRPVVDHPSQSGGRSAGPRVVQTHDREARP